MRCFITILVVVFAALFSCRPNVSGLRAVYPTLSDIKLYPVQERNAQPYGQRTVDVLVSTSYDFDTVAICEGEVPDACGQGQPQYQRVSSIATRDNRRFFHLKGLRMTVDRYNRSNRFVILSYSSNNANNVRSRVVYPTTDLTESVTQPTTSRSSGQSGGVTGHVLNDQTHEFQGARGSYRLWAPATNSSTEAHPLIVFFSDDGGDDTLDQERQSARNQAGSVWSQSVFVKIRVPRDLSPQITWNTNLNTDNLDRLGEYAHNLLQEKILTQYNIDLDRIYLVGRGSGASFVANTVMPKYARYYQGGALVLCGGEAPRQRVGETVQIPRDYRLHMETTRGESQALLAGIDAARRYYQQELGAARANFADTSPGSHCDFRDEQNRRIPQVELVGRVIAEWWRLDP